MDESGFSLALYLYYGWGRKGELLVETAPFCRGMNLSVLGALDAEGIVALHRKEGAMKRCDFEEFLARDLLPQLLPGSVLVQDNARIHHGGAIEQIVTQAGCRLLYLPPYSPDFFPIELAWSWIKRFVRRLCPRTAQARLDAIEQAIAAMPDEFARGWFQKCGYGLY